jgi:Glycosyl hydrolase family 67 C-terminus
MWVGSTLLDMAARRWWIPSVLYALVALLIGFGVAQATNGLLSLSMTDKQVPAVAEVPVSQARPAEPPQVSTIGMPRGYADDPLLVMSAGRLQDALEAATGNRPDLVTGRGDFTVEPKPLAAEAYQLSAQGVSGQGRQGMANGLLAAADAVSAGTALPDLTGMPVVPDLTYRFADYGAVGVEPDPQAWAAQDDYSHNSRQFADVVLSEPPWVDPAGMERVTAEWERYIDHIRAYGYNGVIVSGFLEYVNFDDVGDGYQVYGKDSPYRARHDAMVEQFGAMWKYADDMGMRVVFKTDMLANTGPLNDYVERELGGFDVEDPRLWELYQAGLAEFFEKMPYVDGLMIRIGEAGNVYNLPGWDYFSTLAVTTVDSVRTMLTTFTDTAAEYDKTIYFRTWSVGVGEVGDMHTNPQSYQKVLDGIPAHNLVVVTKFTMGDFYSWLPLNPTLEQGEQSRIVEFQSRREFEAFSSFPNYLSADHQVALQDFEQKNPRIAGVWVWTQDGGPWRAGPMSLYLKSGFWQLYDLDVYATGRLAWDRDADLGAVNAAWIRQNFSDDPQTVTTIEEIFRASRQVAQDGLYIRPYADKRVLALGLEPPPMMWIFEWDIVSGDTAALSVIHNASRGRIDEAIAQAESARQKTEQMLQKAQATDPADWKDPALRERLIHSLEYQVDLFATLGAFRAAFLSYYDWLDTGDAAQWQAWQQNKAAYDTAVAEHVATYGDDLDTPAYSFFAVDAGFAHAERTRSSQWLTLAVLVVIAALLLLGSRLGRRWHRSAVGMAARGVWVGMTRPWRLDIDPVAPRPTGSRLLAWAIPAFLLLGSRGAFSGWLSWSYLLATVGSMALFTVAARSLIRGRDPFALYAGVGAALLLKTTILSLVVVVRGPLLYWYRFWTDEQFRTIYVTLSFAAFLWLFWVTFVVMRSSYDCGRLRALGRVLVAVGVPMLALGGLMQISGLESALTTFNDQMALLPLGLSRILGLTVHLGIPTEIPLYLLMSGLLLAAVGLLLGAARRTQPQIRAAHL